MSTIHYHIVEADRALTMGYLKELSLEYSGDELTLNLVGFQWDEQYRNNRDKRIDYSIHKKGVSNINLQIVNASGQTMGEYFINLSTPIKNVDSLERLTVDEMSPKLTNKGIKIWDLLDKRGNTKNLWVELREGERKEWLDIAMLRHKPQENVSGKRYSIEMKNINSAIDFYCALGEAMNGPGGYYGKSRLSLRDCCTGGFGTVRPFEIELIDYNVKSKELCEVKEILMLLEEYEGIHIIYL